VGNNVTRAPAYRQAGVRRVRMKEKDRQSLKSREEHSMNDEMQHRDLKE